MKIRVSPVVYVLATYLIIIGKLSDLISVVTVITAHELAHYYAARRLGYTVQKLSVSSYGASMQLNSPLPDRDELIIAAVGPLFTLLFGMVMLLTALFFPVTKTAILPLLAASVSLFVVNVLPVYPLDGGRVVSAILRRRLRARTAYKISRILTLSFGIAFLLLFILSCFYAVNVSFITVSGFMLASAVTAPPDYRYEMISANKSRHRKLAVGVEIKRIAISENSTVKAMLSKLSRNYIAEFIILSDQGGCERVIKESELYALDGEQFSLKIADFIKKV